MHKRIAYIGIVVFVLIILSSCAPQPVRILLPKFAKVKPPVIRVGLYFGEKNNFLFSSERGLKVYTEEAKIIGKSQEVEISNNTNYFKIKNGNKTTVSDSEKLFIVPESGGYIKFEGNYYPGIIVVLRRGLNISIINYVNLEDYVLGVIPYEIPEEYSDLDFLKAQAIAIRSYAFYQMLYKNKYKPLGFDICSSYMCQVYRGVKENINKNFKKAVSSTKGKVAVWDSKPALTLYSAFCGGETEDAQNLFSGIKAPYLKGRKVYDFGIKENILTVNEVFPYPSEIDLALNLGIIDLFDKQKLSSIATKEKIKISFEKLGKLLDKEIKISLDDNSFVSIVRALDDFFGIYKKAKLEISRFEVRSLWKNYHGIREKIAYKFLMERKIANKGISSDEVITLSQFIRILMRTLENFYMVYNSAKFVNSYGQIIVLNLNGKEKNLSIKNLHVYYKTDKNEFPLKTIILTGKENIKVFYIKGKIKIMKVSYPKFSYSIEDKRFFPYWVKIYSKNQLQYILGRKYEIGELEDIVILKRGKSFRVNEIEIQGSKENVNIRGVGIKYELGLKDTYFILNRNFDDEGKIKYFIFIGKGNGHGVGMCQFEAYLLGENGKDYREILTTFYPGIQLKNATEILKENF